MCVVSTSGARSRCAQAAQVSWRRRTRLFPALVLGLALIGVPADVPAQTAPKVHRIGWLGQGSPTAGAGQGSRDFLQGLRDMGYIDGKNVVVELRYASGSTDRLAEMAAELVRLKVDAIVTSGPAAAFAAKRATRVIPIVATEFALDPVKAGLVSSLGQHDGNVTGISSQIDESWPKRVTFLRELVPKIVRLGVLWNSGNAGGRTCLAELRIAARSMSLQLQSIEVIDAKALEVAFAMMARDRPDALALCWDTLTLEHASDIAAFARAHQVPTLAPLREYVEAGALMSFGMNLAAHRRRAAHYVDRIFKGASTASLPLEQPMQFEMVINVSTAKALGIPLPPAIVLVVDELIP